MVRVDVSDAALETGALFVEMLTDQGVYHPYSKNVVAYGVYNGNGARVLNENCRSNKVRRMRKMDANGVNVVPWFHKDAVPSWLTFPLLARRITGHGGTDIVPVFEQKEISWRVAAGWDWFSQYVPTRTEFRVWVYRDEVLDTYEKVMKRPEDYKYVGRNFRNGFDFQPCSNQSDASNEALNAVMALGLDFGAVDLLLGEDEITYVLEVNTAPGVIKSGAQGTLKKLVDRVMEWDKEG